MTTKITVLVDNEARGPGLEGEHGLALWIEHDGRRILFDTGQTNLVTRNGKALSVPMERADVIVISHGHHDHTGGLPGVLSSAPGAPVYLHGDALRDRYSRNDPRQARQIGMSLATRTALKEHPGGVVNPSEPMEVAPAIWVSGPIPRTHPWETVEEAFFLDADGTEADHILDEQSLWIETMAGWVIITGCTHAGIANTITHARKHHPDQPIAAVIGGLHLRSASPERLVRTMDYLVALNLKLIATGHCTGTAAQGHIAAALGKRAARMYVGKTINPA